MSSLDKINKWLNSTPPAAKGRSISFSLLVCSFTYLCLGVCIKYFTLTAPVALNKNIFIITFDTIWIGYFLIGISCLPMAHYFRNTTVYKNSILIGVTSFIFINLLMMTFIFIALFATIQASN